MIARCSCSYAADDRAWRWQDQVQLELFGAQAAILAPAMLAPFPAAHPTVTLHAAAGGAAPPPPPLSNQCAEALATACADDKATGTEAECEDCVVKAAASTSTNCTAAEELGFC